MPQKKKTPLALKKPLSEVFNQYARDAVRDFPHLDGKFAILDVAAHDYHGEVDLQKSGFASDAEFVRYLSAVSQSAEKKATSKAKRSLKNGFCLIVFNGAMKATGLDDNDVIKTLDHELGHLVIRDASGGARTESHTNFKECAADVFACLKHMQRFGAGSNLIEKLAWKRAISFVLRGKVGHFTTFALEALKALQHRIDFKALTPQQMAELSWNIAVKFSLSKSLIKNLDAAFKPVRAKIRKDSAVEAKMKLVADFLCGDVDYHTLKSGLAFLNPYFETGAGFKGKALYLSGEYWDGVKKTLKEKELKLADNGLLFNMPVVKGNVVKFTGGPKF